jgi:hypothetical protein
MFQLASQLTKFSNKIPYFISRLVYTANESVSWYDTVWADLTTLQRATFSQKTQDLNKEYQ